MYASGRDFAIREALDRIKPPDSVTLLRPIKKLPCNWAVGVGAGVAYPLCFRQIGFAAAKPVFSLLGVIDVNSDAIPLYDEPIPIAQGITASLVPTIFTIPPTQAMYNLVGCSGLNCVTEGLYRSWKVGRVYECFPTTMLKFLKPHATVVQSALIDIRRFAGRVSGPEEAWYRVDNLMELVFALPQCFLGTPLMPARF
jgi:hypothetical protein